MKLRAVGRGFRRIPGWDYEVSRTGTVRNLRTGRRLRPYICGNTPSLRLALQQDGLRLDATVARLVSLAFEGPIAPGHVVQRCGDGLHLNTLCRFSRGNALAAANRRRPLMWSSGTVKRVRELRAKGKPYAEIAKITGVTVATAHAMATGRRRDHNRIRESFYAQVRT